MLACGRKEPPPSTYAFNRDRDIARRIAEKATHLHLAFTAESRQQVQDFYRAALEAGAKDNGAPGLRPQYSGSYYAAFVIGPDGHNIEAVFHEPEA
jgi:predicted lactoylglutathione lyase